MRRSLCRLAQQDSILALPQPLPRPSPRRLLRRLHRASQRSMFPSHESLQGCATHISISFDSLAPARLNGTLRPQSRAALTGLPTAISPHLFQEIWFTLAGCTFVQSTQAVPTAMCSPVADLLRVVTFLSRESRLKAKTTEESRGIGEGQPSMGFTTCRNPNFRKSVSAV